MTSPIATALRALLAPVIVFSASIAMPVRADAQNEAALRAAFEGKTITVKVDMPATSRGIDLFPDEAMPVDWREMANRMKDNGTALRIGQTVMITKVIVKKDSHIELQLGGGGYGTLGDHMSDGSTITPTDASESARERQLRDAIKTASTPTQKKQLETELTSARSERERENARGRAAAEQANAAREANLRSKRVESGSRFNIRYKHGIPADAMTPAGVRRALAAYADFSGATATATVPTGSAAGAGALNATASGTTAKGMMGLRKGLSIAEVEALLGPATTAAESREGALTVMKRSYVLEGRRVSASFVNDVLIEYLIAPQ